MLDAGCEGKYLPACRSCACTSQRTSRAWMEMVPSAWCSLILPGAFGASIPHSQIHIWLFSISRVYELSGMTPRFDSLRVQSTHDI
jgi:hypothetical protein